MIFYNTSLFISKLHTQQ